MHQWKFFTTTESAWNDMLTRINLATESILLEQFVFSNDLIGRQFSRALEHAAKRGVKIKMLIDQIGSVSFWKSNIPDSLRALGIEIIFFNPLLPFPIKSYTLWYFRNHRRLLIIDNLIAYTGGVCISDQMKSWRDSMVRIEGSIVQDMKTAFESLWIKNFHFIHKRKKIEQKDIEFSYLTLSPFPRRRYLYYRFLNILKKSRSSIKLVTPYLLPDHALLKILKKKAEQGVLVEIIVPQKTDYPILDIAAHSYFTPLLKSGIKIFRYQPSMIHAKYAIVDNKFSTIGSMNLDNVSLRYNLEANIISKNIAFAAELAEHFSEDKTHSKQLIFSQWNNRSPLEKIKEWLMWPLRKLL